MCELGIFVLLYVLGAIVAYVHTLEAWMRTPATPKNDADYAILGWWTGCIWPIYAVYLLFWIPKMRQAIRDRGKQQQQQERPKQ